MITYSFDLILIGYLICLSNDLNFSEESQNNFYDKVLTLFLSYTLSPLSLLSINSRISRIDVDLPYLKDLDDVCKVDFEFVIDILLGFNVFCKSLAMV